MRLAGDPSNLESLTEAEKACLRAYGIGANTAKEVARMRNCATVTVEEHFKEARRKLGVSSTRIAARLLLTADAVSGFADTPSSWGYIDFGGEHSPSTETKPVQDDGLDSPGDDLADAIIPRQSAKGWGGRNGLTAPEKLGAVGLFIMLLLMAYGASIYGLMALGISSAPLSSTGRPGCGSTGTTPLNPKQKAVAARIGVKMNFAERRCDSAIEASADLLTELGAVRAQGGIGAEIAQPVVEEVAAAIARLSKARARLVAAHKSMTIGAAQMDFEPFTGEGGGKPPPSGLLEVSSETRIGERAAA